MARPILLHLISPDDWRTAQAVGAVRPPSLTDPGAEGFTHLSTPEQVYLPANRLFAGRDDMLLLVVDPAALTDPVRYEPGVPTDPESMRFPHLYGPIPVEAVIGVTPYRPGPGGAYRPPVDLPNQEESST